MKIRKYDGEADGWLTAVARGFDENRSQQRRRTGWDDDDAPFQIVAGEKYYIQGDYDPNVFEVDGSFAEEYIKVESGEISPNGEAYDSGETEEEVE